jgi:hypothetical protein
MPERSYTKLKSLHEFDSQKIQGIVSGLLSRTERDNCIIGNYYRGRANVETLLSLKSARDLQAIAMIARGLFELVVDAKLINVMPNAIQKILAFSDLEKIRAAQKIVKFATANAAANMDASIWDEFIANNEQRIEARRQFLWPRIKTVRHWSGLSLSERSVLLRAPLTESTRLSIRN